MCLFFAFKSLPNIVEDIVLQIHVFFFSWMQIQIRGGAPDSRGKGASAADVADQRNRRRMHPAFT